MPIKNKDSSQEQIKHNQSLWKWFPLGQVVAIWSLIKLLNQQTDFKYSKQIDTLLKALQALDDKIRADNYPLMKKKRVK